MISGAVSANPGAADAQFNLGAVLMAGGKLTEACRASRARFALSRITLKRAATAPHCCCAWHAMQKLWSSVTRCSPAAAICRRPGESKSAALLGLNRPADALATLDQAVKFSRNSAALWRDRAFVLVNLQQPRDALTSLDKALQLEPRNAEFALRRADLLAMLKQNAEAVAAYDRALALNPNDSDGWNRRGIALVEIGKKGSGRAALL